MAAVELRNGGYVIALGVTLDNNVELSRHSSILRRFDFARRGGCSRSPENVDFWTRDRETEQLFHRFASLRWSGIARAALRKLRILRRAKKLDDLRIPLGNRLEPLRGDRSGEHVKRLKWN